MSSPINSSQWMYASGGFYDHIIDQSLRFDDGDSAKLVIDPTQDGDKQKFTWSGWVKRGNLGLDYAVIFSGNNSSGHQTDIRFEGEDTLRLITATSALSMNVITTRLFRDTSSWYHIVVAIDTTQSTLTDRFKVYVNGVQETSFSATTCTQNHNCVVNTASNTTHNVGANGYDTSVSSEFDGYLAEVHFVDGTQYAASEFGETKNGVWIPKSPSVTYGTNGFHMKFDQTGTDADSIGIGADSSGNDHHFTVINLVASDVMPDSPTNNFATLNPLFNSVSQAVLLEGNLKAATAGFSSSAYGYGATSTFAIPNDKKIYIEVECTDTTGDNWFAGFATKTSIETGVGGNTGSDGSITVYNRSVRVNGTEVDYGSSAGLGGLGVAKLAAGDILGLMIDGATGKVWASRNGTYFKSPTTDNSGTTGDPAGGSYELGTLTGGTTDDVFLVLGGGTGADNIFVNFGQDSVNVSSAETDANGIGTFEYAPPTNYLCLCSSNLPDPPIDPAKDETPEDHFNTVLWTGDNSVPRNITGVGFSPDWMWVKDRIAANNNVLVDTVRGISELLYSNSNVAGVTSATQISAVGTDGFTIGATTYMNENGSSNKYVAWNWLAGTAFSNDASATSVGSIDSEGQVNTTAGFSIIKFTTDGETSGTVAHGLGVQPQLIIGKTRNHVVPWYVQTPLLATNLAGILNATDAFYNPGYNHWNDTHPTTSVFSVGGYMADHSDLTNPSTKIVYCFANVEGYQKIGVYEGNGNADGAFVFTGFRPAWILLKDIDSAADWQMYDNKRYTFNQNAYTNVLEANNTGAETTTVNELDLLSNGFKLRSTNTYSNANNKTFLYLAIAEQPFKYANAR